MIIKLKPEVKAQEAGKGCLSSKFLFVKMDKALELQVISVPQGHTIPSGATVITDKISMPNVSHLFDGKAHKSFLAVSQRNMFRWFRSA